MSDVFSVLVPVLEGGSGVSWYVRMRTDTLQVTVWRESNLMSKEPASLGHVLSGLMVTGER